MVDTPTADSPREPDITHVNPAASGTWFGHPKPLFWLFGTEMWERFGYYGMRALLTIYLTKHFVLGDRASTGLYGGYTALVYLTPLVGGFLADQYLGSKRAVKFGALMMAVGYFTLAFGGQPAKPYQVIDGQRYEVVVDHFRDAPTSDPNEVRSLLYQGQKLKIRGNDDGSLALLAADGSVAHTVPAGHFAEEAERDPLLTMILLIALSVISVGNGFFKPNISTMVGELYAQGDRRRDSGFTIFYMGINTGSFLGQILCPIFADVFGWPFGLGFAGVVMLISWAMVSFHGGQLALVGNPPADAVKDRSKIIYLCALLAVPAFYFLFTNLMSAAPAAPGSGFLGYLASLSLMGKLLFGTFLVSVPAIILWSWFAGSRTEFQMMMAAMVLVTFNVIFWTLFEQAGSSLTLFADRNTDLSVFGLFSLSAPQTQNFNSIAIMLLAPVMSVVWGFLARRNLEPSIPVKFGIALMGVGAGFLFLVWGTTFVGADYKVGLWWLAGLYVIHSLAELCISPVGLSMITKLSIARVVGLMMGVWFLSISVAQYVAGVVAQFASVDTVGGQVTNLKVSLDTYVGVFVTISEVAIALGVVLLALSWPLKRWMHGVT
ncbi:peptide MFS transporter [Sphingomonas sp. NFR15]|uniref:peptide MFS transporter n=1 Tax=Sphingomonas sp. NFR15 TaxID=1566282 RepID=UPI0008866D67|nr:peptide MFS transporter [Sphingomonas sp. NFR15]SDA16689.1 proton-dependent oligopeptide transporter, POT family [Sphingomonas sp. NFR15]